VVEIISQENIPETVQTAAGERLALMIAGANAKATRVAPCLAGTGDAEPTVEQIDEARLVLLGAITRWTETGAGAYQQQTAGPFSVTTDTRQRIGYNLWPSEIADLQAICKGGKSGIFAVDTVADCSAHAEICALNFGATYCSCGADIAGFALYEEP